MAPDRSISLAVLTKNSEKTLGPCLESVQHFCREIILVDDLSTDGTLKIAERYQAKVFSKKLESFGAQKQYALDQCRGPWIFLIDSDESAPPELAQAIEKAVSSDPSEAAFRLPRRNFYFGRWLKHGGKYPDFQTRLLKKNSCRYSKDIVHEKVEVSGSVGTLSADLHHQTYPDLKTWTDKLEMFARFRAEELRNAGLVPGPAIAFKYLFFRPVTRFIRRFFFRLGILDGAPGFLACAHDFLTEMLGYLLFVQTYELKESSPAS